MLCLLVPCVFSGSIRLRRKLDFALFGRFGDPSPVAQSTVWTGQPESDVCCVKIRVRPAGGKCGGSAPADGWMWARVLCPMAGGASPSRCCTARWGEPKKSVRQTDRPGLIIISPWTLDPGPCAPPLQSSQLVSSWPRSTMWEWTWAPAAWGRRWWAGRACWGAPRRSPSASGSRRPTTTSSPPLRSGRNAALLSRFNPPPNGSNLHI